MLKLSTIEKLCPTLVKYGFDCEIMGVGNYIYSFMNHDHKWENVTLDQAKKEIQKIKNECKQEILDFLSVYGVENGGSWFYCEYLNVENEMLDTNGTYFGLSRVDNESENPKNIDNANMWTHELLQDIKGL